MTDYKIPTVITVTSEDIDNIVDSAVNYCSYWCDLLTYGKAPTSNVAAMSEALSHGGTLKFYIDEPFENDGKTEFELTLENILKGIEKYGEYDFEQFDGPMSDAVVQMALFGDVIYG